MSREIEKSRLFTRRAVLVGGFKMSLLSLLLGRLYYLQILQQERYLTLAEENRINLRLIVPPRGIIYDRMGVPLAVNQQNYRLVLLPEQIEDMDEFLDHIAKFIDLSDIERKRILRDYKMQGRLSTILVRDNLTWQQVSLVSLHMPELIGADIEVGEIRTYPFTEQTSHLIGYVGPVTQDDKKKGYKPIPGFHIGKSGVEKQYDPMLRGEPGDLQLEVNARGRVVRELARHEPMAGRGLNLTIDVRLQQVAQKVLAEHKSGAAVVLDIYTGAIYALVSYPGYDPNLFTYGISQKDWDLMTNNEYHPLLNKALDGVYAPGSTFKIVTSLAGLESGILDPTERTFCPGHYDLGNHRFYCWKKGGHGPVNFIEAMAGSCDTYFYDLGKRIGIDRLYETATRLGFGKETGIDFPHERTGLMPSRGWKMATRNGAWQQGETLIAAIGQGYVLASPMQLAVMMARIANGGYEVSPRVHRDDVPQNASKPLGRFMGFDRKNLAKVLEAVSAVVNSPLGTAYESRIMEEGYSMAGKTGTAQVRRISSAERADGVISNDALPWKERDHALFVGYGPVQNPRYAAAVIVEHGGSGAHVAAPVVRDILAMCEKLNPAREA